MLDDALRLADEVLATCDDSQARAEVTIAGIWIQLYTSRVLAAADDAVAEADRIRETAPELARRLRLVAALGLLTNGPYQRSIELADPREPGADISSVGPTLESTCVPAILGLVGRVAEADLWLPPERVGLCAREATSGDFSLPVAMSVQLMALALLWTARPAEAALVATAAIERLEAQRQPRELPVFFGTLGEAQFWQGRWDETMAAFEQAAALADETHQEGLFAIALALSARLLALRGDLARCDGNGRRALEHGRSIGSRPMEM
jgi:hypothetical protein